MSTGNLAKSLEKLVNNSAKQLGKYQLGVNKVLWGNGNTQPNITTNYSTATGTLQYSSSIATTPSETNKGNILNSGVIHALNVVNQVDICNVITYLTTPTNKKSQPRPPKPWSAQQATFYTLQDECRLIISYIDTYVAHPNTLINSYLNLTADLVANIPPSGTLQPPNGTVTQEEAKQQTATQGSVNPNTIAATQSTATAGSTDLQGTDVLRYNTYFLLKSISDVFTFSNNSGSLFTPEDRQTLQLIPGIGNNLNILDDFIGITRKYDDYRQIDSVKLQAIVQKVNLLRTICVTVTNLNFDNALVTVTAFLPNDIRSQIQQISKFLDPKQLIPTLKQINAAIQSFILIGKQIQGILKLGQLLIKLGLLFNKVYKFVITFLLNLPVPGLMLTGGMTNTLSQATQAAKNETDGLTILLKAVNALLSVVVNFIRYLLASANEILVRLQKLLTALEGCDAMKDSDIVAQLRQTANDLQNLQTELGTYITSYDLQTSPTTTNFQGYTINVIPEEVSSAVIYPRRRGIALDQYGEIVAQSDLTFATDNQVIIAEVQQKLVSLKLAKPSYGVADATNLAIINTSLTFLDTNDVQQNDLNLPVTSIDAPNNLDENSGLGLNAFINNLKGGKALRRRTRSALDSASQNLKSQISSETTAAKQSITGSTG